MSDLAPRSLFAPPSILSRQEAQEVAQRVLRNSPAPETRVSINSAARADTRFALNQVTTSGENQDTQVTITAYDGNRAASVNTNRLDEASLAAAAKQAYEIAKLVPPNPERMPELGGQEYPPMRERQMSLPTPEERAAAAKIVTELARKNELIATGFIECRAGASALANSKGLFAYDATSSVTMTSTVRSPDGTGSGWACTDGNSFADLDPQTLAVTAVQKAKDSRSPVAIEPGRYTTILEPTAVGNLVQLIAGAMQARAADEGRSFFTKPGGGNKIGLKVVDDRVTLLTDPADSPSLNGGYDEDGLALEKVVWIENGVVKNLNYDRYWAQKQGKQPTRAGGGGFRGAGRSLRMMGGTSSVADMVKSTERGVLVTRFWYIRPVDARTILYTGLTRDGTFLVENGKVTRPIKNFRFNESPIFFLNNLDAMGPSIRINASENLGAGGAVYMPAIKVRDFTFSSLSDAV
ncbi:TldD/PmbA family protein [Gemmatimonas phototrophica]|uniref:Peptidase C69 n=1 Tax=Gemmatimonas phototrophica TaxID=1379270 RepID=A0A143BG87_9BACT|nr:TldD/PmbA family protein [Gemmatimonas phototrophica]AMW04047.1 peptidase C69 [Gemmatimonas phototrophica]